MEHYATIVIPPKVAPDIANEARRRARTAAIEKATSTMQLNQHYTICLRDERFPAMPDFPGAPSMDHYRFRVDVGVVNEELITIARVEDMRPYELGRTAVAEIRYRIKRWFRKAIGR